MTNEEPDDHARLPGLYRLWDSQSVLLPGADYKVLYAEMSSDGTPPFMVFKRPMAPRTERVQ